MSSFARRTAPALLGISLAGAPICAACQTFGTLDAAPAGEAGVPDADGDASVPDGSARADAIADAVPFRCKRDAALLLCDDFDNPPPSGQWAPWDQVYTGPAGIAAPTYDNTIASSKPNSLRVDTGRAGANRSSYLIKSVATTKGWKSFTLSTRLYVSSLLPATGQMTASVTILIVRLAHSAGEKRQLYYRLRRDLADSGGSALSGQLQGLAGDYLPPAEFGTSVPMNAWVDLTTRIENNGSSIAVEVIQNGKQVVESYVLALTPPVTVVAFNLGTELDGDQAGADVRFDDVTIGD